MKKIVIITVTAAIFAVFACSTFSQSFQMSPLVTFGTNGDGSIRQGEQSYLTDTNQFQRGLAYNPITGHLLLVNRFPVGSESINILDGIYGTNIGTLDLSSITIGGNASFVVNLIGVAGDGSIYVGNLSSANSPPEYRLYRWANETAPQQLVYFGDPSNGDPDNGNRRWGDTMAVRGAGTNTQVLIASRGRTAAILRPTDDSLNAFTSTFLTNATLPSGALGYGLTFGVSNRFWGKAASSAGEPLYLVSFDLDAGTMSTLQSYSTAQFPGRTGPIYANTGSNLLVGVEMTAGSANDFVRLYDISTTNAPVFLDRRQFFSTNGNANFAGSAALADGRVYVLDSDNGLVAYSLVASNSPLTPSIFLQPQSRTVAPGTNVTFTSAVDGSQLITFQWQQNSTNLPGATNLSLTLTNVQEAISGRTYRLIATNDFGSVTSSVATLVVTTNLPVIIPGYEPFNYTAGTQLSTNGGWIIQSGGPGTGTIQAGNLDADGLRAPSGNRYAFGTANAPGGLSHRLLFSEIFTGGELYYSILLRVDDLGSLGAAGVPCGFAQDSATLFAKLNMQPGGVGYQLGCSVRGTGNTYDTANSYALGQTVLVVERYTFVGGGSNDKFDLWVNPNPASFESGTPPTPNVSITATAGDLSQIDRFFFRNVSGAIPASIIFDELRIGTTWESVTPRALPQLGIAKASPNVVLFWPTNASDYQLQSAAALGIPTIWTDVTNIPVTSGTNRTVTLSPAGVRYFRLSK